MENIEAIECTRSISLEGYPLEGIITYQRKMNFELVFELS